MKSQYRQKFYDLYLKEILPLFVDYEHKRKQMLSWFYFWMFVSVAGLLCSSYIFLPLIFPNFIPACQINNEFVLIGIMLCLISSIIALCILPHYMNKKFKKMLKNICKPSFAKCFNNLSWDDSGKFNSDIFVRSFLFSSFNTENYDDIFSITHEGVKIDVVETHLEDVQGSGKNRRTINVFKGVVIIFPSNKTVKAQTIVTTKGDRNIRNTQTGILVSLAGAIAAFTCFLFVRDYFNTIIYGIVLLAFGISCLCRKKIKMEGVKLEDVEFDKRFQVASEDQLEARYLITPAFMDRLKALQTAFGTQKVKCSFFNNQIMFAISTKEDLFEVGSLFVPLNNSKQMTKFFNELTSILEMVDHFKLDQKIGL